MIHFKKYKEDFPSASLLLDISRNEYERQREHANMLDNKASFFISAIIAIITLFIPLIPFSKLIEIYRTFCKTKIIITTVMLCVVFTTFIFVALSLYNLYQAYKLKEFKTVNVNNLNNTDNLCSNQNQVEKHLIEHYNKILVYNIEINKDKAKRISIGLRYCIISFIFLCVSTIGLTIIIGG